jgi:hypothetical protein
LLQISSVKQKFHILTSLSFRTYNPIFLKKSTVRKNDSQKLAQKRITKIQQAKNANSSKTSATATINKTL